MGLAVHQGDPDVDHRIAAEDPLGQLVRAPFSTEGMNCRGTAPPTTFSANSMPAPRSNGSISIRQTAYWPWPPDCFTSRPCTVIGPTNVSRNEVRSCSTSTATCQESRRALSNLSTWAGPIAHSTTWCVSALCSSRMVTSSAASRCRADASFSSSARELAWIATGSSGSGNSHGSTSAGLALQRQGVGGLRGRELGDQHEIAGYGAASGGLLSGPRWGRPAARPARRRCRGRDDPRSGARRMPQVAGDVQRGVGPQGAGEHPDQAQPADERGVGGPDDFGHQGPVGIAGQVAERLPSSGVHGRQRRSRRRGEAPLEEIVEALDPQPAAHGWR